jgi:hypothetical protein
LPPIALGEVSIEDLKPCDKLAPDGNDQAGGAYVARAQNDGVYVACQDRHTGLASIVWEAIARGLLKLREK